MCWLSEARDVCSPNRHTNGRTERPARSNGWVWSGLRFRGKGALVARCAAVLTPTARPKGRLSRLLRLEDHKYRWALYEFGLPMPQNFGGCAPSLITCGWRCTPAGQPCLIHSVTRYAGNIRAIVNVDTLIGCRLFTANDPDSAGIAQSAPELETVNLLAAQRH